MGKTIAYLRASTDKQDLTHQELEILEYARRNGLPIDDFVSVSISSRKNRRERKIDELLAKLSVGDTLVVTELSRLGRSTGEVITLINELVASDIRVVVVKQNLTLDKQQNDMQAKIMTTLLSLFAELERDLISLRTREALAAKKARGARLGRPRVLPDEVVERIAAMADEGMGIRRIAATLNVDEETVEALEDLVREEQELKGKRVSLVFGQNVPYQDRAGTG